MRPFNCTIGATGRHIAQCQEKLVSKNRRPIGDEALDLAFI